MIFLIRKRSCQTGGSFFKRSLLPVFFMIRIPERRICGYRIVRLVDYYEDLVGTASKGEAEVFNSPCRDETVVFHTGNERAADLKLFKQGIFRYISSFKKIPKGLIAYHDAPPLRLFSVDNNLHTDAFIFSKNREYAILYIVKRLLNNSGFSNIIAFVWRKYGHAGKN